MNRNAKPANGPHERRPTARSGKSPIYLVDTADIPGGGVLKLLKCDGEFSIQLGEDELMGTRDYLSETALATITAMRLGRTNGHVLVGGLGMGFTLRAALSSWGPEAKITVAELLPEVVDWAHGPLAHLFGSHLADPRLNMRTIDVHVAMQEQADHFDAILLDVDNGPEGFMTAQNDRLYTEPGLQSAFTALRSGGYLAIWSSYRDHDFAQRLASVGFVVEEVVMPAYVGSTDTLHNIWFALKPIELDRP